MFPYLLLFTVILFEGFMYCSGSKTKISRKRFIFIVCLEVIIFAGLRKYTVGADTEKYIYALTFYRQYDLKTIFTMQNPWNIDYEVGYMLLTKTLAAVRCSDILFLFIIAILTYVPVFWFIRDESCDIVFSTIIYLCFELFAYSLGIFRQMIAVSFLLFAFRFIKSREPVKYFLIVLLAMSFHTSAIIAIPVYFCYRWKFKKIYFLLMFIIEIFVFVIGSRLVNILFSLFPKYLHYIGSQYGGSGGGYTLLLLLHAILFCGFIWNKQEGRKMCNSVKVRTKTFDENECMNNVYMFSIFFAILITAWAHTFSVLSRLNCLFLAYMVVYIPNILQKKFNSRDSIFIKVVATFMLIIYFYCSVVNDNETRLNPYMFYWMK